LTNDTTQISFQKKSSSLIEIKKEINQKMCNSLHK
jgi:hypothetical protein